MIYSQNSLTHSFNVIYKAEEYTTKFGLLVTAMSDPFDKTILSGMSIRYSPEPGYLRVDMGTFDYGKYIVQTNKWVDLKFPDIPDDLFETVGVTKLKFRPGFSFRFLPEEETKDRTVVPQIKVSMKLLDGTQKDVYYDLRSKDIAFGLAADTPSVKLDFKENMLVITGFNSVDYSKIIDVVEEAYYTSSDQNNNIDVDDPKYRELNSMNIVLKDDVSYVKLTIDDLGNVVFTSFENPFFQFVLVKNKYLRYYFRRALVNDDTGLTIAKEWGTFIYGYQISEIPTAEHSEVPPVENDGTLTVNEFSDIALSSNVNTTITSNEYGYLQKYHWVELFTNDEFEINQLLDINVQYYQVFGSDFDESYFGMSFTPDKGLSWFYCNTINDIMVARFVSFDPVLTTPISPEIIHYIFSNGLVQEGYETNNDSYVEVTDEDFGYPTYEDYFTDEDKELYEKIKADIDALDNSSYTIAVVDNSYINQLLKQTIVTTQTIPFRVAVTFKYFHDSNLIEFYVKDLTDIDELDCIVGLLETVDAGQSFEVVYRDPVYQRMIPYAEWCDAKPVDIALNASFLANAQSTDTTTQSLSTNSISDNQYPTLDSAIGNTNTTYSFSTLGDDFTESASLTSMKLYSVSFIQSMMLLYDFDYCTVIDTDVLKVAANLITSTGFIYKNICYLDVNQYIEYNLSLPQNATRLMIVPVFDKDVVDTDFMLLINGEKFAPYLELDAKNRDFTDLKIRFIATRKPITIFGFGVLYDVEELGANPLRINNMHNRNIPYFDYTKITYNQELNITQVKNMFKLPIKVSWDIHSDLPDDDTYVEIYMYDNMIYRSPNLGEVDTELLLNTSAIRYDDNYIIDGSLKIPIVFKAINKFGERTVEHAVSISMDTIYNISINDFKYVLVKTITQDQGDDDPDNDVTYYKYMILISIDTNGLENVYFEFWNDYQDPSKGIFKAKATPQIVTIDLLLKEDELPRTTKLYVYTDDKEYEETRTLTISN